MCFCSISRFVQLVECSEGGSVQSVTLIQLAVLFWCLICSVFLFVQLVEIVLNVGLFYL